jgi:hypothetical protein
MISLDVSKLEINNSSFRIRPPIQAAVRIILAAQKALTVKTILLEKHMYMWIPLHYLLGDLNKKDRTPMSNVVVISA